MDQEDKTTELDTDEEFTPKDLELLGRQYVMLLQIKGFRDFVESNYDIRLVIDDENKTIDWEISMVSFEEIARRMAERNPPVKKLLEDNPDDIRKVMEVLSTTPGE